MSVMSRKVDHWLERKKKDDSVTSIIEELLLLCRLWKHKTAPNTTALGLTIIEEGADPWVSRARGHSHILLCSHMNVTVKELNLDYMK